MLRALGLIIIDEVPVHFMRSDWSHELALAILNLSFFQNIDWLVNWHSLIWNNFSFLFGLKHPCAVTFSSQILIDETLNYVIGKLMVLE